ncbi:hypothetical protein Abr02nite_18650 [Paractinoplanes brasiliensis]|nr:hypothetical protein Abr02nite_18650 [Actinoplanes brasiliensis]
MLSTPDIQAGAAGQSVSRAQTSGAGLSTVAEVVKAVVTAVSVPVRAGLVLDGFHISGVNPGAACSGVNAARCAFA